MVWLLLLLGLIFLIFAVRRSNRRSAPRTRDRDGSGMVMLDGAPIIGPNDDGFGLADGFVHYDHDDDDTRFHPGGGSGGGAGASGSWDDGDSDGGGDGGGD